MNQELEIEIVENDELAIIEDTRYSKSNFLISAKYASSLLENKIIAISLHKIQKQDFTEDEHGRIVCSLYGSELRRMLEGNGGSFYAQLEPVAKNMTSRTLGFSDPNRNGGEFDYISVIDRANYKDGVFKIFFNPDLKEYFAKVDKNFTILELSTMLLFKSVYSFRLYELLRSKMYVPKGMVKKENGVYRIEFNLSELKLDMGVVNAEIDSVRRVLRGNTNPDYDAAVAKSPEKKFNVWYDFKRYVIDVAISEINEKTDIHIEYEKITGGRGGRVRGVTFYVSNRIMIEEKEVEIEVLEMSEQEKLKFHLEVMNVFQPYGLTVDNIVTLSEACNYQLEKLQKAERILSQQKSVKNTVGFLIDCVKNDYQENISYQSKEKPKNQFHQFSERPVSQIELDELEKKMINRF